jgi:hypothetical protein
MEKFLVLTLDMDPPVSFPTNQISTLWFKQILNVFLKEKLDLTKTKTSTWNLIPKKECSFLMETLHL